MEVDSNWVSTEDVLVYTAWACHFVAFMEYDSISMARVLMESDVPLLYLDVLFFLAKEFLLDWVQLS